MQGKYTYMEVCDFLQFGFPIGYVSNSSPVSCKRNHSLAHAFASHVDRFIVKEVSLGAVLGPFTSNPLGDSICVSPVNTAPKKDSDNRRIILDLSFPEAKSVNAGIPKDSYLGLPCKVK